MGQLGKASAWLAQTMATHNSSAADDDRTVIYLRGTTEIEIAATFDTAEIELTDASGQLTIEQRRVAHVNTSALVVDGKTIEPDDDDQLIERVTTGDGTREYLYSVVALPGKGTHEPLDNHRHRIRIFLTLRTQR
ncbi:hypothetical protein U8335_04035 [Roseiconus lacunae]|uniref:Phage head-tail joining protein domain-containing protein n=1 Tax=Roseiconus lacunae TaxID=2605694 RepID=A0ABT7PHI1_9BACT|nr:hypothetical protein [Roseiconus lacunae]MDM4015959.1 hypothetical protein [Roseiconus lacunae]WRQ51712.1 hypothetical protein U8335_04035 [Stieleria sp. HD01]